MKPSMEHLHIRYVEGMSVAALGGATVAIDVMKMGTVVLGFIGACLAALGGWEAWRAKRLERRAREIEIQKLTNEKR